MGVKLWSWLYQRMEIDCGDGDLDRNTAEVPLLINEVVVSRLTNVLLTPSFCDRSPDGTRGNGLLGTLLITDFRLSFAFPNGPSIHNTSSILSRSEVCLGIHDVVLLKIDTIYYKASNTGQDKWHRIVWSAAGMVTSSGSAIDRISQLRVQCRDARTITFDFRHSCIDRSKSTVNVLLHYAHIQSHDRLFAFTLALGLKQQQHRHHANGHAHDEAQSFNCVAGWNAELARCDPRNLWNGAYLRVSHGNKHFQCTETYPKYIVVPRGLLDSDLEQGSTAFNLRRFPVWVWATNNGCSIFRCSKLIGASEVCDKQWNTFVNAISSIPAVGISPPPSSSIRIIDVTVRLKEISAAHKALLKIISMDTLAEFRTGDSDWLQQLHHTDWLQLVFHCLTLAAEAVESLNQSQQSVIIRETDSRDMACVISSLVQLILDVDFRTLNGFLALLQKDWVAFGHPFALRLFGLETSQSGIQHNEMAPVFLLFLDCVHQLLRQNPTDFEFTEHFLIAMYDLALCGLTRAFSFNCIRQHERHSDLLSSWSCSRIFTPQYRQLFVNPLYVFRMGLHRVAHTARVTNDPPPRYRRRLALQVDTLANVHFWTTMFLRWCNPAQWLHGGTIQEQTYFHELVQEVTRDLNELFALQPGDDAKLDAARTLLAESSLQPLIGDELSDSILTCCSTALPYALDMQGSHATAPLNSRCDPFARRPTPSEVGPDGTASLSSSTTSKSSPTVSAGFDGKSWAFVRLRNNHNPQVVDGRRGVVSANTERTVTTAAPTVHRTAEDLKMLHCNDKHTSRVKVPLAEEESTATLAL